MRKVALVYNQPLNSIDGASKVVSSFSQNRNVLSENGIDLTVFAPEKSLGISVKPLSEKITLKSIAKSIVFKLDVAGVVRSVFNLCYRSKKAYNLYKNSKEKCDFDVLFFHEIETCYHYLRTGGKKPVVLVLHTTGDFFSMDLSYHPLMRYTLFYNLVLKRIEKQVIDKVDRIVFNSQLAAQNFERLYPKARKRLATYVDNGVVDFANPNKHLSHPDYSSFKIVCVGSISERKGQRFIVEAIMELSEEELEGIHFEFVGIGPILQELEEKVKAAGLEEIITFCGEQRNIIPYLDRSNIFILPSINEGMPIAILEAMRSALPIVSTRVGGIPYQVQDGVNGILIDASTEGIKSFLRHIHDYDWKKMGQKSRERYLDKFTMEQFINRYSDILKNV